jgi:hypothetical protein
MGEMRNAYKILIGEPQWNTPFEGFRWEDHVKMYLREAAGEGVDWIHSLCEHCIEHSV